MAEHSDKWAYSQRDLEHLFVVTLGASPRDVVIATDSMWIKGGRADLPKSEVRIASPVKQEYARYWKWLGENHIEVHSREELWQFLLAGGHALVRGSLIAQWWPVFFDTVLCARTDAEMAFWATDHLPSEARDRFAKGSLRQYILWRDEGRCRMCGRSPDDALDIKLEIHHVVANGRGGLTVADNLIVLCKTCHDEIDLDDHEIASHLVSRIVKSSAHRHRQSHNRAVRFYRRHMKILRTEGNDMPPAVLELTWPPELPEGVTTGFTRLLVVSNSMCRAYSIKEWRRIVKSIYSDNNRI